MKPALLAALGLALLGCGRQELDLLVPAAPPDACAAFTSERACHDNASLGCSFQPNATGCLSTDASCQPGQCRGGDPFVRHVERSFLLNGEAFRFVGVSSWALLPATSCSGVKPEAREAWIDAAYDGLVPSNTKVARFFAFQGAAGAEANDFELFDASVRAARRAGVRLQFVLEHAEGGCSQGEHRDSAWYGGGFKSPDGNYTKSYRDWAESLARRYQAEPTVLGYALMQGMGFADAAAIQGFVADVGQLLHGVAPNQLVSLDLTWGSLGDDSAAAYREIEQLPVVDFIDGDDYAFSAPPAALDPAWLATLADLDKPSVIGEGAFKLDGGDTAALERRAEKARRRMTEWKRQGFDGALFWAYQPGWGAVSEEFDTRASDPMLAPNGVVAGAPW